MQQHLIVMSKVRRALISVGVYTVPISVDWEIEITLG
jgi:hypothetical protein